MKSIFTLLLCGMMSFAFAQVNCPNNIAPVIAPYPAGLTVCTGSTNPLPTLTTPGMGLPNLEYIILNNNNLVGGTPRIVGATTDGVIDPSMMPDVALGDELCIVPVMYDLTVLQSLVDSLLTSDVSPGFSCCALLQLLLADVCGSLNGAGIASGSDITTLADVMEVVRIIEPNSVTMPAFLTAIDQLNAQAALLPTSCGSGWLPICYAVAPTPFACFTYGIATTFNVTPVSSIGGNDGSAEAIPVNGTAPYTYAWSNGATTAQINNLTSGTYTVTITDATGCTGIEEVFVADICSAYNLNVYSLNVQCFGQNDGVISVTPLAGVAPYQVEWSTGLNLTLTGAFGSTFTFLNNLEPGIYSVDITDALGCIETQTFTITEPAPLTMNATVSEDTLFLPNMAMLNGLVSSLGGGNGNYFVSWNFGDGTIVTSQNASHTYTMPGNYLVSITAVDGIGCDTTALFNVVVEAPIGIQTLSEEPLFSLFPNPANQTLNLTLATAGDATLGLFDVNGKNIRSISLEGTTAGQILNLPVSDLNNGVYILTLTTDQQHYSQRFSIIR